MEEEEPDRSGAFALVFRTRYLLLIGLLVMLLNFVNTNGGYILARVVAERAAEAVAAGQAGGLSEREYITAFYGSFYFWVNLAGALMQLFLVSRVVKYLGVGTVEFLVAGDEYHFLEMNPRLQVEHGVTETITGLDLVQLQIRIARGETIATLAFEERGCAIEARICAEDTDAGGLPAPGRIARFEPAHGPRVRIDTGVTADSEIPASFDSLVAKVIASGDDREESRARPVLAQPALDHGVARGATQKGYMHAKQHTPDRCR